MTWSYAIRKVELFIKYLITGGGRFNFLCDSHINLCWYCARFRVFLRGHKPPFIIVNTKHATYVYMRNGQSFAISKRLVITTPSLCKKPGGM